MVRAIDERTGEPFDPVRVTTSVAAVRSAWTRLVGTARECGMDADLWELREPEYAHHHWLLQFHDGPHGAEARFLGRARADVVVALHALEAILRQLPGWQVFHDRLPAAPKSGPREKTAATRPLSKSGPTKKTEPPRNSAKSWPPKKTEP